MFVSLFFEGIFLKNQIVVPGDFLTTEEEFNAGNNTFESDGRIFADSVGIPVFDQKTREVKVEKLSRTTKVVDIGTIVFGKVVVVRDNNLIIELMEAEKDSEPRRLLHSSATLMIRRIGFGFIKSTEEEFKIGDIVKAKVVEVNKYGYELSTADSELGVVKAFCSQCRSPLHVFSGKLKCLNCHAEEKRKTSKNYVLV